MKFSKTTDASSLSLVYDISDELTPVFDRLERAYAGVDIALWYAFRCLPDALGRRTTRRFSKRDNAVCMDLCFSEDRFKTLSRDAQRHEMSHLFFDYTAQTLDKYEIAGLDKTAFLTDLKDACHAIGWLKESWEVDL